MMPYFSRARFSRALIRSALALATLNATTATQAETGPGWETLLRMQLEETQKCVMSGTVFVRELPVNGGVAYSGRAICLDGRLFDFSQSKPHLKFEITTCDPTYC